MVLDGYTAVYDAGETSEVAIDFAISIGTQFVNFAALISLVFIVGWLGLQLKKSKVTF